MRAHAIYSGIHTRTTHSYPGARATQLARPGRVRGLLLGACAARAPKRASRPRWPCDWNIELTPLSRRWQTGQTPARCPVQCALCVFTTSEIRLLRERLYRYHVRLSDVCSFVLNIAICSCYLPPLPTPTLFTLASESRACHQYTVLRAPLPFLADTCTRLSVSSKPMLGRASERCAHDG